MNARTENEVESWESRSFSGGFNGLQDLSDAEFSGVVRARETWLFMLNGRVVGIEEGTIDDFRDADGTIHEAPHHSLPMLFAMQEAGGSREAKYYTNDTPISEVDETLSSGNFTGYVELSENVLSGDYYLVYYGGRSMSVALVGNQESLVTGEEAFERANDEVGIYEVVSVDVEVIDVPEPDDGTTADEPADPDDSAGAEPSAGDGSTIATEPDLSASNDGDSTPSASTGEDATRTESPGESSTRSETDETTPGADESEANDSTPGADESDAEPAATESPEEPEPSVSEDADTSVGSESSASETAERDRTDRSEAAPRGTEPAETETGRDPTGRQNDARTNETSVAASDTASTEPDAGTTDTEDRSAREAEWRETKRIPSLNPDRTGESTTLASAQRGNAPPGGSSSTDSSDVDDSNDATDDTTGDGTVSDLRSAILKREDRIDRLEDRASRLKTERDDAIRERDRLRSRINELESTVEELRTKLRQAESSGGVAPGSADQELGRDSAIAGTNLFIRYETKGGGTLEKAREGSIAREEVNENLRIEHHTQFNADAVTVEGRPFEEFLANTIEYQFVRWLVEDLLYEIRDTGHTNSLSDLYDTIPEIDRAELDGNVSVEYVEDGEEYRDQQTFDVVLRDRMGNPLIVATLNDSRDPATEDMMVTLLEQAERVAESNDGLGGAFLVTASFFDPGALEAASEATSTGLLGGGSKESFVKLSRKRGYHLCLVETRGGEFHVNVPEL